MGTRNSAVRKLAIPDTTTTVLTLTVTGIAADSTLAKGNIDEENCFSLGNLSQRSARCSRYTLFGLSGFVACGSGLCLVQCCVVSLIAYVRYAEPLTLRDDDLYKRCTGRKHDCLPSW